MKIGEYEVVVLSNEKIRIGCQEVSRAETVAVLRLMDNWTPTPKFKVGDFVKVILSTHKGLLGKIVVISDTRNIGVEFAERRRPWFSNLGGYTKDGHGYWFSPEMLELVD